MARGSGAVSQRVHWRRAALYNLLDGEVIPSRSISTLLHGAQRPRKQGYKIWLSGRLRVVMHARYGWRKGCRLPACVDSNMAIRSAEMPHTHIYLHIPTYSTVLTCRLPVVDGFLVHACVHAYCHVTCV